MLTFPYRLSRTVYILYSKTASCMRSVVSWVRGFAHFAMSILIVQSHNIEQLMSGGVFVQLLVAFRHLIYYVYALQCSLPATT